MKKVGLPVTHFKLLSFRKLGILKWQCMYQGLLKEHKNLRQERKTTNILSSTQHQDHPMPRNPQLTVTQHQDHPMPRNPQLTVTQRHLPWWLRW